MASDGGSDCWFFCPGCESVVTSLVRQAAADGAQNGADGATYSSTHCCVACERGEGTRPHDWGNAGVPRSCFLEVPLPSPDCEVQAELAHCVVHVPEVQEHTAASAPALLFLHGGVTYVYPETLWWDVRELVEKNPFIRDNFVVIAPFATAGEPLAVVSETREKADRFGRVIPYADDFDEVKVWHAFLGACAALRARRVVDPAKLHVVGYSMGAQGAWNLAARFGSHLASLVPFAGCCSWRGLSWDAEEAVFAQLRALPIRSFNGEDDTGTHPWRDVQWLAQRRGLANGEAAETPAPRHETHGDLNVEVNVYSWEERLQLHLVSGTRSSHCCWDVVFHNEHEFGLFTWMAGLRTDSPPTLPHL
eukprot:TRINITY_DN15095_c0_g1_i5.p1 TRINITY_DN15095_c0_g1~~TRINITY_DN15095_c0_g1_i5.p1  ORF type:complete len:375 (+),score=58.14 TRINITY_DN15095_c0_g1_i5:39-1127(+)